MGTTNDSEFKDRTVVITGAAGVIGGWIADAFARRSANLVLCDRRPEKLQADLDGGRWNTSQVTIHSTELRDPGSITALAELVRQRHGAAHFLVNNAGIYPYTELLDLGLDEWNSVMETNVNAPLLLTQAFARLMIEGGIQRGSIVNIVSSKAFTVSAETTAYSVSKAALAMLTRGTALALAPHGIRVNCVAPGFIPGSDVSVLPAEYIERVLSLIPLGRASGPFDAPEVVAFLCSDRAEFITGAMVPVDGGRLAGPITSSVHGK